VEPVALLEQAPEVVARPELVESEERPVRLVRSLTAGLAAAVARDFRRYPPGSTVAWEETAVLEVAQRPDSAAPVVRAALAAHPSPEPTRTLVLLPWPARLVARAATAEPVAQ